MTGDFFIANLSMFYILAMMIQLNLINIPYPSYDICKHLNKGFLSYYSFTL